MGDYNRPLSLNHWMYGYGNPVNLADPTGHFPAECLEADDFAQCLRDWATEGGQDCGDPTITQAPINCDQLVDVRARRACQTYLALRDHSGWWNGHAPGNLTPQAFAGLLLRMEFNRIGGFADVKESIQQETVVRNFYSGCKYWQPDCKGDTRLANDMFAFVGVKDLLEESDRVYLKLNSTDTETTIAAKWQFQAHWGTTDFESVFLCPPGAWKAGDTEAGIGFREWVPDIRSPSGQSYVYVSPMDWGGISMYGHYGEAQRRLRDHWSTMEGLAEWQFYARRGGGDTATIVTISQRKYWNRP